MSLTGQFEVPGSNDTGVEFTNTQTSEVSYTFSPSGTWTPGKDNPSLAGCNAEGLNSYSLPVQEGIKPYLPYLVPQLKYPNNTPFALLAANKTTGAVTEVGKETTIVLKAGETLVFILNDMSGGYSDNEGAVTVQWSGIPTATPKVVIYEDANFQGASQELTEGSYNIVNLTIGNDKLSSLRVPAGIKVTLYEHDQFAGRSKTFTQDASWVGDDFNDITSSVKVEKVSTDNTSNKEIEDCQSIISELQLYKQRNWAIGLNGDTLQPDGFVAFFTARSLPFEYYVRSGGVSRGDASAYDRNIATLENYIKSL